MEHPRERPATSDGELLKADCFGQSVLLHSREEEAAPERWRVRRDANQARWWLRPLARRLAARETAALTALSGVPGVPRLLAHGKGWLLRSWLPGRPLQQARPSQAEYFRLALRLLAAMHRRGVAHNDLAKEPNWLVQPDGAPALVDYQLAAVHRRRGAWFRLQAREDLRHLLKHKRSYCPQRLTARERRLLATPSWPARLWRRTGKRVYLWITRGWLGWADREGAGDRW